MIQQLRKPVLLFIVLAMIFGFLVYRRNMAVGPATAIGIAGIVENMTGFTCPDCGHTHQLFSSGGGEALARRYGAPLLAQLPINPKFMAFCDNGDLDQALENAPEIRSSMENVIKAIG